MKGLKNGLMMLGVALMLALPGFAADRVTMKDGRVFVGDIVETTENYVRVKVTTGALVKELVFWMNEVASIERDIKTETRDSGQPSGPTPVGVTNVETIRGTRGSTIDASKHGVIVLPLSGMVGIEFRHQEIEAVGKEADRIKELTGISPIIVLDIESGGGLVIEMEKIHQTLVEIRKRHRVVAWIREAISAACATALHCHEIYFRTEGNAGAMTMFAGTRAVQGEELERWLRTAGDWAEYGGRSRYIAEAMIHEPKLLSYDKDPVTGEVTWYNDLSGEFVLSRAGENLSFTVSTALHSGFADGRADTEEELAKLLDLPAWHEVSDFGRRIHKEWNATIERARVEIPRLFGEYQIIQGSSVASNAQKIRQAITLVEELIRWWDRCPNVCEYEFGIPPKDVLERQLRELKKQLADLLAQERRGR